MIPVRLLSSKKTQLRESVLSSLRRCDWAQKLTRKLTLAVLEVVEEDMETLRLDTVVLDDNTAATNDLTGVALTVNLAETSPGTENLGISDLDQVNLVFGAKGLNELDVLGLSAGLDEDAKVGLTLVEGLGALTETASKTVMDEGIFQNLLNRRSTRIQTARFC